MVLIYLIQSAKLHAVVNQLQNQEGAHSSFALDKVKNPLDPGLVKVRNGLIQPKLGGSQSFQWKCPVVGKLTHLFCSQTETAI